MTLRIDCHVHTRGSFDSEERVGRVLQYASMRGLDGVVVTDHDSVSRSLEAVERAPEFGLVGIPGVEVSTADGHLLAIGLGEAPPTGLRLGETVGRIRDDGGVAVVPHPSQRSRHGVPLSTISDCDGIETLNAHSLTGIRNRRARTYARRMGYPRFGGSDAHRAEDVGAAYTEVGIGAEDPEDTTETARAVVEVMREGRVRARGDGLPAARYLRKCVRSARRAGGLL